MWLVYSGVICVGKPFSLIHLFGLRLSLDFPKTQLPFLAKWSDQMKNGHLLARVPYRGQDFLFYKETKSGSCRF